VYCNYCVKESFADYIKRGEVTKLVCFSVGCGTKATQD
jgi:hypothetical protein